MVKTASNVEVLANSLENIDKIDKFIKMIPKIEDCKPEEVKILVEKLRDF